MFPLIAHASLAMQTAFSCLLVCLLEFYYRRIAREAWLRWFAFSWVAQTLYVASIWIVLDNPHGGVILRVPTSLMGFVVPCTFALTGLALLRGRSPAPGWTIGLYLVAAIAAAVTFVVGMPYPIDGPIATRIHNVPRFIFYGLGSLLAAIAFAQHFRRQRFAGSAVVSLAWAFFAAVNFARAWLWFQSSNWALSGAENNPELLQFALMTFITNSVVWIAMSLGVGLMLTETTERSERRSRQALRELQAAQSERGRLAQLVEQCRDAILVASEGQLRYLNTAASNLLGYKADEIPSLFMKALAEVCGAAPRDPMRAQMDKAVAQAGAWQGESDWRNWAEGDSIPVLVSAFALSPREGEPPSIGLIARDLRERLRLEDELRQAQRQEALGRLAGGIAHDFNNLLTVIMGYSSLALESSLEEPLRRTISEILTAARRAAAITDRLRGFGRRQALHAGTFDLNALVDAMRGTLDKLVEGDVDLRYELSGSALPVRADRAQIEQVLMNLVLNARQAIDGWGHITVRTSPANEYARIEVEDTGSGIEPEVLEHIFDPYFTTRSAGSGLGLSMAYGIVRQSDGEIHVDSRPGHGSVFAVLLPVSDAEDTTDAPPRSSSAATAGAQAHETVMVVDDRPEVAAFVAACLGHYGYNVRSYTDSESALEAVRSGDAAPQLIVRDVMMPGMALKEFAHRLHALLPGLPFVCMSGLPESSVAPLLEGAGGYFIAKPFTPEHLADLVRRVLDAAAILARE